MTIIDTTLFLNGELRLTHNVLVLDQSARGGDWSGTHTIPEERLPKAIEAIKAMADVEVASEDIFEHIANKYE